jgi:hypothetical protein
VVMVFIHSSCIELSSGEKRSFCQLLFCADRRPT